MLLFVIPEHFTNEGMTVLLVIWQIINIRSFQIKAGRVDIIVYSPSPPVLTARVSDAIPHQYKRLPRNVKFGWLMPEAVTSADNASRA